MFLCLDSHHLHCILLVLLPILSVRNCRMTTLSRIQTVPKTRRVKFSHSNNQNFIRTSLTSVSRFRLVAFLHRCQPTTDPRLPEAQPSVHALYVRERPSSSQLQQPLHQQRTKQTWGGPSRKKPSKLRHFASPPVLSERPLLRLRSTSALHGLCMVRQAQQLCTVRQAQQLCTVRQAQVL